MNQWYNLKVPQISFTSFFTNSRVSTLLNLSRKTIVWSLWLEIWGQWFRDIGTWLLGRWLAWLWRGVALKTGGFSQFCISNTNLRLAWVARYRIPHWLCWWWLSNLVTSLICTLGLNSWIKSCKEDQCSFYIQLTRVRILACQSKFHLLKIQHIFAGDL